MLNHRRIWIDNTFFGESRRQAEDSSCLGDTKGVRDEIGLINSPALCGPVLSRPLPSDATAICLFHSLDVSNHRRSRRHPEYRT